MFSFIPISTPIINNQLYSNLLLSTSDIIILWSVILSMVIPFIFVLTPLFVETFLEILPWWKELFNKLKGGK